MTQDVNTYFIDGCGRCKLGGTPQCKVNTWKKELQLLREILISTGLNEECKWGMPCYTHHKKNIAILAAYKDSCVLSFFNGALLQDHTKILVKAGENTQSARIIRFTQPDTISKQKDILKAYIFEAIEIEKAGIKVTPKKSTDHTLPVEFEKKLKSDERLRKAFYALTPGRQRAYLLYFSGAKQSKTIETRIEKCLALIYSGQGLNDK